MTSAFAVSFDYASPFARNASEHVVTALAAGAPFEVRFVAFSLAQGRLGPDDQPVWDDPTRSTELLALAAGVAVRDRWPELFATVHLALFRSHFRGDDLRRERILASALAEGGADPEAVLAEVRDGWPQEVVRSEHEDWVRRYGVFGTPTFVIGERAAFVRVLTRPDGDPKRAVRTVDRIIELVHGHPEINELKHLTPYAALIERIKRGDIDPSELHRIKATLERAAVESTTEGWEAVGVVGLEDGESRL